VTIAATTPASPTGGAGVTRAPKVSLGVDQLFANHFHLVNGKRVGLITNTSGVDSRGKSTLDRLVAEPRLKVTQLYGPEHGIRLQHRNNHTDPTGVDSVTGIPLQGVSCSDAPRRKTLRRIDVLLFDVQDIGSRTYTYVTTMGKAMTAAAKHKVPFIVLDRPNPNGGKLFEGPIRRRRHRSVVGWAPIPVTHGMTVGELARWYNKEMKLGAQLTVVPMKGWRRDMMWEDTGLQWVPTSTAITHVHHAHLYVATGMVGGAGFNIDDGVAAGHFFERYGGTFINAQRFTSALMSAGLPGVRFEPVTYQTYKGRYRGKDLHGAHVVITDAAAFRPLRTALTAITTLRKLYRRDFRMRRKGTFGRVWGTFDVWRRVKRGQSPRRIEASWRKQLRRFNKSRKRHLLYQ
jgi:uncharacterized protein YbbC (DUF1343 family)